MCDHDGGRVGGLRAGGHKRWMGSRERWEGGYYKWTYAILA